MTGHIGYRDVYSQWDCNILRYRHQFDVTKNKKKRRKKRKNLPWKYRVGTAQVYTWCNIVQAQLPRNPSGVTVYRQCIESHLDRYFNYTKHVSILNMCYVYQVYSVYSVHHVYRVYWVMRFLLRVINRYWSQWILSPVRWLFFLPRK